MLWLGVFLCVWGCCLSVGISQPVSCTGAEQCGDNYYCDTDAKMCRECLSCQELKREPPLKQTECVTSIYECGDCSKGFVKDRLGDVNTACVLSGHMQQYYWWIIGSLVLVFLIIVVIIVVCIFSNPGVFKNIGNCARGTVRTNIMTRFRPSAPEMPPPPYTPPQYNSIPYSSVRDTESPYPPHSGAGDTGDLHAEEEGLFIKSSPASRPTGDRQASDKQGANVFQLPIYERGELPRPASPIEPINDNHSIHGEETMESLWTPDGPSNGDINANVSEPGAGLGALLAAARDTELIEHTPPKRVRLTLPSSNDRNSNATGDSNQGSFSGSQNGPFQMTQINANLTIQFNNNA